jgi:putative peptidoglycan lipid II flippase
VEFALLRRTLNRRIGRTGLPAALVAKLWSSAALAAAAAWGVKLAIGHQGPILGAAAILLPYGVLYFGVTYALRVEECARAMRPLARLRRQTRAS